MKHEIRLFAKAHRLLTPLFEPSFLLLSDI